MMKDVKICGVKEAVSKNSGQPIYFIYWVEKIEEHGEGFESKSGLCDFLIYDEAKQKINKNATIRYNWTGRGNSVWTIQ